MKRLVLVFLAIFFQLPAFANQAAIEADNIVSLISNVSQSKKIQGTIKKVDVSELDNKKMISLNFGKNYNTSFSATISEDQMLKLVDNPEKYYKNKHVEVEGVIRLLNGKPEVILNSPDQIKFVE